MYNIYLSEKSFISPQNFIFLLMTYLIYITTIFSIKSPKM